MGRYRDDHDAALHRGAALERELAQVKAELSAKEQALEEASATFEAREAERAEAARLEAMAAEQAEAAGEKQAAAARELEALRSNAEKRLAARRLADKANKRSREATEQTGPSPWPERLRMSRSLIFAGELLLSSFPIFLFLPLGFMSFALAAMIARPLGVGPWIYRAIAIVVSAGLLAVPGLYVMLRLWWLRRWVDTRPYELVGYPDVLALAPPKRDGGKLSLIVEFEGPAPDNLHSILEGFDQELEERAAGHFVRSWPVTKRFSKSGSRWDNADTNWKVHRWVLRLERKVLRPLHQAAVLRRVSIGGDPQREGQAG